MAAVGRMQADMQDHDARIEGQHAKLVQLVSEAFERVGPAPTKPYIAKGGRTRFKLHVAAVDGTEVLPTMWKTKCGVKFASWSFTRHGSCEDFPKDTLCTKCFGSQHVCSAGALKAALVSSASSSSSSSGAASSEA